MLLGHWPGGMRLSLLAELALVFLEVFGQWTSAITNAASILVAAPAGGGFRKLFGVADLALALA